jgi:GxxExxY protein
LDVFGQRAVGDAEDWSLQEGGRGGPLTTLHHGGKEDTEETLSMLHDAITERVLGAAMKVHTALGAGCLESTYDACLRYQLTKDAVAFEHQRRLPVMYDGVQVDAGYRIDFLVENCVIVELKAVEKLLPLHLAQVLTYLKLSRHQVGLLINFNVAHLRDGIKRVVNGYSSVSELGPSK